MYQYCDQCPVLSGDDWFILAKVAGAWNMGMASPPYLSKLDFPESEMGLILICLYCFQSDQAFSERGIPLPHYMFSGLTLLY